MRVVKAGLAVAVAMLGLTQQAHAQNLLANGGFETPTQVAPDYATFNIPAGSNYITGWTVTQGNVDLLTTVNYGPGANTLDPTSKQDVDLVGDTGGSNGVFGGLSQSFATVAGQQYSLTFEYSHNTGAGAAVYSALVQVRDGNAPGTTLYSATVTQTFLAAPWTAFSDLFTATSNFTTLSFTNTAGGAQGGIFLDDASVSPVSAAAVPEPAVWAMMILGMGAIGFAMRRQTRRTLISCAT